MFSKRLSLTVFFVCVVLLLVNNVSMAWTEDEKELAINAGKRLSSIAITRGGGTAAIDRWERRVLERIFDDVAREASRYVYMPYTLHIMNSRNADGWSYSDGSVYVTRGLLDQLDYYDEIAGIFGHLLAHVVLKHNIELMLETEEGQNLLEDIATGLVEPTDENLGKYRYSFLALRYTLDQERDADDVGVALAYNAGYRNWGLELAHSKIAAFDINAPYFNTHPHPNVKPYSPEAPKDEQPYYEPERPRIIDAQPDKEEKSEDPEAPGEEEDGPRPSASMSVELFLEAGQYPYSLTSYSTELEYEDDSDVYRMQLNQKNVEGSNNIGGGLALSMFDSFFAYTKIGFGLQGGPFTQSTGGSTVTFELGGGVELGSDSASLKAGAYWGVTSQSSRVGEVQPVGDSAFDIMVIEENGKIHFVDHGTPINARTSASGIGGFATLDIPVSKDGPAQLFVTARYQAMSSTGYTFTAKSDIGTVTIPFEGPYPESFHASGLAVTGGLKLKW